MKNDNDELTRLFTEESNMKFARFSTQEEKLTAIALAIIRNYKKKQIYFSDEKLQEKDIEKLLRSKSPKVVKNLKSLFKQYYKNASPNDSLDDVIKELKKSSYGTIVKWKDKKTGKEFYILNFNKSGKKGNIRILTAEEMKRFQKKHRKLIEVQIKNQLKKTYKFKLRKQQKTTRKLPLIKWFKKIGEGKYNLPTAGTFERMRADAVIENKSANVEDLANSIMSLMPRNEKSNYARELYSKGIKSHSDYKSYLQKIRRDALTIKHPEITLRKSVDKSRSL